MPQRLRDPNKVPVQLNVKIPFEFREKLYAIAKRRKKSLNSLVYEALKHAYDPKVEEVRQDTREAGSTK